VLNNGSDSPRSCGLHVVVYMDDNYIVATSVCDLPKADDGTAAFGPNDDLTIGAAYSDVYW